MSKKNRNVNSERVQLTGQPNTGTVCLGAHPVLKGRREIFTGAEEITAANVVEVLQKAMSVHLQNRAEIEYLENYIRGRQPICDRVKKVRNEICNKIVINIANSIVTFKTANFIGEPLQYVSRGADETVPAKIEQLNSFMMSENKAPKDMDLAYWMFTCGVGYRLTLRDKAESFMKDELYDEAPFEIYVLDPRNTFVVRRNDVTKRVLMGVTYVFTDDNKTAYTVYTDNATYYITGGPGNDYKIVKPVTHNFGMIPITEYPCNPLRMGAFEVVIDLLDAINTTESNRIDAVEQFVQAVMVFENVDISDEDFQRLKRDLALKITSRDGNNAKVYYLNEQLDQSQTQTLIDNMKDLVLEIVGMPSQGNANTSDSSNNGAVIMKNGWWNAEARAKETELEWKASETDFLKIALKICRDAGALDLKISDINMKFFRRSYENLLVKVQSFQAMIDAGCPPIQAYTVSGLVIDPESAALAYDKYQQEKEAELEKQLEREKPSETILTEESGDGDKIVEQE